MLGWRWTRFWWGMLLMPVLIVAVSVIEGETVSFGAPLVVFVIAWMAGVLLLMRKFGVAPFTKGDDDG